MNYELRQTTRPTRQTKRQKRHRTDDKGQTTKKADSTAPEGATDRHKTDKQEGGRRERTPKRGAANPPNKPESATREQNQEAGHRAEQRHQQTAGQTAPSPDRAGRQKKKEKGKRGRQARRQQRDQRQHKQGRKAARQKRQTETHLSFHDRLHSWEGWGVIVA